MKDFLKQWIFLFGLIMIFSIAVPAIINQGSPMLCTMLGILGVSFIICLLNRVIEKLDIDNMIVIHLIRFGMILAVVYIIGWIVKWYQPQYWWSMVLIILPVYIVYYIIDCIQVNREIKELNLHIKSRKSKGEKNEK